MRKLLLSIFIVMIISIAACQQAVKKETEKADAMKKAEAPATTAPRVQTSGDAAVDSVGNDLNNVDSVEKDLNTDDLINLDSGLSDVQNI